MARTLAMRRADEAAAAAKLEKAIQECTLTDAEALSVLQRREQIFNQQNMSNTPREVKIKEVFRRVINEDAHMLNGKSVAVLLKETLFEVQRIVRGDEVATRGDSEGTNGNATQSQTMSTTSRRSESTHPSATQSETTKDIAPQSQGTNASATQSPVEDARKSMAERDDLVGVQIDAEEDHTMGVATAVETPVDTQMTDIEEVHREITPMEITETNAGLAIEEDSQRQSKHLQGQEPQHADVVPTPTQSPENLPLSPRKRGRVSMREKEPSRKRRSNRIHGHKDDNVESQAKQTLQAAETRAPSQISENTPESLKKRGRLSRGGKKPYIKRTPNKSPGNENNSMEHEATFPVVREPTDPTAVQIPQPSLIVKLKVPRGFNPFTPRPAKARQQTMTQKVSPEQRRIQAQLNSPIAVQHKPTSATSPKLPTTLSNPRPEIRISGWKSAIVVSSSSPSPPPSAFFPPPLLAHPAQHLNIQQHLHQHPNPHPNPPQPTPHPPNREQTHPSRPTFPPYPTFKTLKAAQDFNDGVKIAISNVLDDHHEDHSLYILEIVQNLEDSLPTFMNDVYDYRNTVVKGGKYVFETLRWMHEDRFGLATTELCRVMGNHCENEFTRVKAELKQVGTSGKR